MCADVDETLPSDPARPPPAVHARVAGPWICHPPAGGGRAGSEGKVSSTSAHT